MFLGCLSKCKLKTMPFPRIISSSLLLRLLVLGIFLTVNVPFFLHNTLVSSGDGGEKSLRGMLFGYDDSSVSAKDVATNSDQVITSACLYTMDDNHYLIEWLAYHYHVMNLRHVIMTTDPNSMTSPVSVLDRWKDRMTIELWDDTQFLPDDFEEIVRRRTVGKKDPKLQYHRARQAAFNLQCLKQHKRQEREWVMMIDVDEYMTFNSDLINSRLGDDYSLEWKIPPVEERGSLAQLLGELILPNPDFEDLTTPCVPVYRRQFAARESPDKEVNKMVPMGFDGHDLQTIRWRKYGGKIVEYKLSLDLSCRSQREVPNKVIIDLGRLRVQDLDNPNNKGNPHQPLESICPSNLYLSADDTPLMVNHYMGTLDQWLYRTGDKRGQGYRLARYEDLNARLGEKSTDQVCPWLGGFVNSIGKDEAARLLQGVGQLEALPGVELSKPQAESENAVPSGDETYKVGDIVQADYKGDGYWQWAEVVEVYSNGFYSVMYFEDCSEEIATFGARMRRSGKVHDPPNEYGAALQRLASEQYRKAKMS